MSLERRDFLKTITSPGAGTRPASDGTGERRLVLNLIHECLRNSDPADAVRFLAPDYRWHRAGRSFTLEDWRENLVQWRKNAPRLRFTLLALHSWPGGAAWRWRLEWDCAVLYGTNIESIREGRIAETWTCVERLGAEFI
jgi:hypothetical protein